MERARLLPQQTDCIQFEQVSGTKSLQLTNIRTESIREIMTTFELYLFQEALVITLRKNVTINIKADSQQR